MPIFSGRFFEILVGRRSETLMDIISKIGVVYVLEPIFTVTFVLKMTILWEKVMSSLRSQVFRRMLIQKVEFFDRYKVGELTGLLTSDLGALKDVVSDNISRDRGLRALSEIVGTICILFTLSSQLAPVLAVLMLSISILVAIFKRSTIPVFKSHGMVQAKISDCANETFSAIRTVRSFAGEERQMSMFGNLVLAFQRSGITLGMLKSANESLTRVVVYISLMALYFLGGSKVKAGLNLMLKCGKVTALVGPSGAGKSTIVRLLARFYEPTSGRITVAGEDIRSFDKREWARAVALVNQEPVLFSVSVGENIAYGLPDETVSREDVIKAAKAANAHEFIIKLPQGYDTSVGERGSLLSGGQRQRIAIARALLKNAPILILDEATSALDAVSERLVQEALDHLMKGRSTLVIAHRLSTVQNAHQIAVCSDGTIAELGTHLELLDHKGLYASLVGTQRLAFE